VIFTSPFGPLQTDVTETPSGIANIQSRSR
jgi:hypothetical protein